MKKLGLDTLNHRMVIISTERQHRPMDKEKKIVEDVDNKEYDKECPFCKGNEHDIEEQTCVIEENNQWIVKSVKNKYPIINDDPLNQIKGEHDVIIDTYKHNGNFFNMKEEEFYYLLLMYKNRFIDFKEKDTSKYICIFKNYLRDAGASLMHPHSQIISLSFIPPNLKDEYKVCEEFYNKMGINMYEYIIDKEIKYKKRLIYNNEKFLVFVPEVCRFGGDTIILFKKNIYFYEIKESELKQLSFILKKLFNKIYDEYGNCPFNLYIHSHPVNEKYNYKDMYNVHIHIVPREFNFGGFELSTGIYVSSIKSEDIAEKLRFN